MNPFNLPAKAYLSMYANGNDDLATVMWWFSLLCSALILWTIAAIFIPGINFAEHIYMLFMTLMVEPVLAISEFFRIGAEMVKVEYMEQASTPLAEFSWMVVWLAGIGLSLAVWPAALIMWGVGMTLGYVNLMSGETRQMFMLVLSDMKHQSVESANIRHLIMGRTSLQHVYDSDVQANSIAEAFKQADSKKKWR